MIRPCFLVIDQEFSGTISTRKLVIETAKFNVITAYSAAEGLETLAKFPALDGIVLNSSLNDMTCSEVIQRIRPKHPHLKIVAVHNAGDGPCVGADYIVAGFKPEDLLEALRKLEPTRNKMILERELELEKRGGAE